MIVMKVNVKRPEDLEAFMDALHGTGSFYEVLPERSARRRTACSSPRWRHVAPRMCALGRRRRREGEQP